jgi:hypothetical protein
MIYFDNASTSFPKPESVKIRTLLANAVGKPELADYNKYPNWEQVKMTRNKLEQSFSSEKLEY